MAAPTSLPSRPTASANIPSGMTGSALIPRGMAASPSSTGEEKDISQSLLSFSVRHEFLPFSAAPDKLPTPARPQKEKVEIEVSSTWPHRQEVDSSQQLHLTAESILLTSKKPKGQTVTCCSFPMGHRTCWDPGGCYANCYNFKHQHIVEHLQQSYCDFNLYPETS